MDKEEVESWLRAIEVEYECGDLTREEYLKEKQWYLSHLDKDEEEVTDGNQST